LAPVPDTERTMGQTEALSTTLEKICPLSAVRVSLGEGLNRILGEDVRSLVDSPSTDASLMDGYAVSAADLSGASKVRPVALKAIGTVAAGDPQGPVLRPQQTLRVLTGGSIPAGANAVIPEESVTPQQGLILFHEEVRPGSHVLPRGSDVAAGQLVARAGQAATPGILGLLAAAGHSSVRVIRAPAVAIIATGDEVLLPGELLPPGKLYASNLVTLDAWCRDYGFPTRLFVVSDEPGDISDALVRCMDHVDAVITSGGARTGDRDMVTRVLHRLGWKEIFKQIRMTPGKGTGFGLLDQKPVFLLPGTPTANMMGFLQIALPGLLKLAGHSRTGLPEMSVLTGSELKGGNGGRTRFVFGTLERQPGRHLFYPSQGPGRLPSMARAGAIVTIPEGETHLPAGMAVKAQVLNGGL
jgi:molybdopterin molybdotransferase